MISEVRATDRRGLAEVDALLAREGIRRDRNLDYTCVMYDDDYHAIATGSCFGNTLRCFAVSSDHQGEGLLNEIVTHLMSVQAARGNFRLFLYTKPDAAKFFADLGFHEIARVENTLVFMENRRDGFSEYLRKLSEARRPGNSAAVVMNANPFTLGHLYLVETASAACDTLHLFMVSEDASLVPYSVRARLIREGTAHLRNVVLHESGPYIVSAATFPSYFLRDETAVIEGQAKLDLQVFVKIASALDIRTRYVGEEPTSQVTGLYNQIMKEALPKAGIACVEIPRKEYGGAAISASTVRQAVQRGDFDALKALVPETTYRYFTSEEAAPIVERIRRASDVVHY
ncbi:MAG: [Oscillibacter sp.]|nr:[citrate (pro-3S)-lyase] ligase [Oscillibacter sp.]